MSHLWNAAPEEAGIVENRNERHGRGVERGMTCWKHHGSHTRCPWPALKGMVVRVRGWNTTMFHFVAGFHKELWAIFHRGWVEIRGRRLAGPVESGGLDRGLRECAVSATRAQNDHSITGMQERSRRGWMVDLGEPRDCQLLRSERRAIITGIRSVVRELMGCELDSGMASFALSSSWEDPWRWRRKPPRRHGGVLDFSFAVPDGKEDEYEMRVGQRISRSIPNGD